MKYGINIDAFEGLPYDKTADLMKEFGFSTTFLLSSDPNFEIAAKASEKNGIFMEFLHAPYVGVNAMWEPNLSGEDFLNTLFEAIDVCSDHNIPSVIFHISSGNNPPNINDVGLIRFERLIDYALKKNVAPCFENQRKISNIAYLFEKFPEISFCWDTGHEECFAHGTRFMPLFGNKLKTVHIHDNHCVPDGDEHLLPFDGCIDFDRVAKSIAEVNFENSIMLETSNNNKIYNNTSPEEYFSKAAVVAQQIISKIKSYS